jgi:hypothetical protein
LEINSLSLSYKKKKISINGFSSINNIKKFNQKEIYVLLYQCKSKNSFLETKNVYENFKSSKFFNSNVFFLGSGYETCFQSPRDFNKEEVLTFIKREKLYHEEITTYFLPDIVKVLNESIKRVCLLEIK